MRLTLRLARRLFVWAMFLVVTSVNAQSVLYFQSKPEHGIAQGQTRLIREVDGYSMQLIESGSAFRATFNATMPSPPNGNTWTVSFSAPSGQVLAIGTYAAISGELDFYGPYSCNSLGNFQVLDIARDVNGRITSLAVDFEHRCYYLTRPPLFGQFRFNSAVPIDTALRHIYEFAFAPVLNATPASTQISPQALKVSMSLCRCRSRMDNTARTTRPSPAHPAR